MLELEQARERILSLAQPLPVESVRLADSVGRILAENVAAPRDLPAFDNSAMDGYAVRAEDTTSASRVSPATLHIAGQAAAGHVFAGSLSNGECVRVFTGSPLPDGANAVAMQEDTETNPANPEEIRLLCPVERSENVRFRGADVAEGAVLIRCGERLTVAQIGLLAAVGRPHLLVRRRPVLGLISTGSELREPEQPLRPGQIYECNRSSLSALAVEAGALATAYPLVPDSLEATRSALSTAFTQCDAVVTSGGVSVGELDLVKTAFEQLGGQLVFWKVAIKPGKPFAFGTLNGKLLFALPGNPVSAFVTFLLLVRPGLKRMLGAAQVLLSERFGVLAQPLENPGSRRHFVRVKIDEFSTVTPTGTQASHVLSSLASANGLVDVPPHATLEVGSKVPVIHWAA